MAAVGVGAAFAGLAATIKVGFDEIAESQKVLAQTGAVLKSTGSAANVTAREVEGLARSLSQMSGVDDEAIQAGENMLLTFTQIRNEVGKGNDIFAQATKATLNLSVAMGKDMQSSAILVGKALNDPIKGMSALSRAGIQFTEEQKKTITALVDTGHAMDAQKIILGELTTQFGGSAKAFGETMPGQLSKLKNSFEEAAGAIAQTLMPHFQRLLDWTLAHMPQIQATIEAVVQGIIKAIELLVPVVEGIITVFQRAWDKVNEVFPGIVATIKEALGIGAQEVTNWRTVMGTGMQQSVLEADKANKSGWAGIKAWYANDLTPSMQNIFASLRAIWRRFGDLIDAIIKDYFGFWLGSFKFGMALIRGDWGAGWDELKAMFQRKWNVIKESVVAAIVGLKDLFNGTIAFFASVGNRMMNAFMGGLRSGWNRVWAFVSGLPDRLQVLAGDFFRAAFAMGQAIVSGIVQGLAGLFSQVRDGIVGGVQGAIDSAKGFFGIGSPSKVTAEQIGKPLGEGIIVGMGMGIAPLAPKMTEAVKKAMEAASRAVAAARGAFAEAIGGLVSVALSAFDKLAADFETKTEKKIRTEDEARAKGERQGALDKARADIASADTPEALASALQAEKDALFAIRRADDEKIAAQERKTHEDRQALRRRHFEEELVAAGNNLERVLGVMKKYHIPFRERGAKLGLALAEGLTDAIADVSRSAKALARVITEKLAAQLRQIKFVVSVEVVGVDAGGAPGRQHGGPVRRGRPYIVGERRAELFVPNQSGRILAGVPGAGGGATYNFHFPNYLGSKDELMATVQREMVRFEKKNAMSFTGR